MLISTKLLPERVRVEQPNGMFAWWATREEAQGYLDRGAAVAHFSRKRPSHIRLKPSDLPARHDCPLPPGRKLSLSMLAGMRTVTKAESDTNPPRVWCFRPLPEPQVADPA
jgi:hypothetical protein